MNDAFSTMPLTLGDWGVCVAPASILLWAEELRKLAVRRSRLAAAPAGA
jgi:P-type Ca2+ transporter type 2C